MFNQINQAEQEHYTMEKQLKLKADMEARQENYKMKKTKDGLWAEYNRTEAK